MSPMAGPKPTPLHHQAYAVLTGGVILLVAALVVRHLSPFDHDSELGDALAFLLFALALTSLGAGGVLLQGARRTPR